MPGNSFGNGTEQLTTPLYALSNMQKVQESTGSFSLHRKLKPCSKHRAKHATHQGRCFVFWFVFQRTNSEESEMKKTQSRGSLTTLCCARQRLQVMQHRSRGQTFPSPACRRRRRLPAAHLGLIEAGMCYTTRRRRTQAAVS